MSTSVQSATALYLHVPFCASSCDFCSFYQEQPKRGEIDRYLSAIDWEPLLALPIDEVRSRLGIVPVGDYEPLRTAQLRAEGQLAPREPELAMA